MAGTPRTWSRALGIVTALVVADVLGVALAALLKSLPAGRLHPMIQGDVGFGFTYVAVAVLVMAGTNQLFGERWRALLVLAAVLASRGLGLYLNGEFPWDPKGDFGGSVAPYAQVYVFLGWVALPLAVGWWTARHRPRRPLDVGLCGVSVAVLAVLFTA